MPPAPPPPLPSRIRAVHPAPLRASGDYVFYWMTAARRTRYNPALQHALHLASTLGRPLLVLEALRVDYQYASPRFHAWALAGMRDNAAAFVAAGVTYLPYVERAAGEGRGLVEALAARAAAVVTDDAPVFFLPTMLEKVAPRLPVRVDAVDGWGLIPLRAAGKAFYRASDFRRFARRVMPLVDRPLAEPLGGYDLGRAVVPATVAGAGRWSFGVEVDLSALPLDHAVGVLPGGGAVAGRARLDQFQKRVHRYSIDRNDPSREGSSGLSPYLHWGHLSPWEIVARLAPELPEVLARPRSVEPEPTSDDTPTPRWGLPDGVDGFVDELVSWREVCANTAVYLPDYDQYRSLPDWARLSLAAHADDPRERIDPARLEAAETPDPVWNAAQQQLRQTGTIHNYLRMVWGKRLFTWIDSPEDTFNQMVHLNNRWSIDGRDPNSWGGISWCFGRYDRPWGPRRPIYGTVRYMSSERAAEKPGVKAWVNRWA